MEVCLPERRAGPGSGPPPTYSSLHAARPAGPPAPAGRLRHALVVGQGDSSGDRAGAAAPHRLGVQERAVGAPLGALGAAGRRLDAARRPLDARERRLGAAAAVLAAPRAGRTLDARPGGLAPGGGDRRVAARQWRSESDLAGSEEAAELADSDSESDSGRQAWRSETHLAAPAAARGTLSQRYRSQPCLLSARPDYSGVSSRVAAYIRRRRQQDRDARARRRASPPEEGDPAEEAEPVDRDGPADCRTLAARLAMERAERRERERQLEQLQSQYEQLVTKYAEAETYIDRMRFRREPGAERPSSEALRPAPHGGDDWETSGRTAISPNETHTSQSSRFSRLIGDKSAILRRHSDEESSFRRFVQSKKELFPDGVGSKDSSLSDDCIVDLNFEEDQLYDTSRSPVPEAGRVDSGPAPAGWGLTSAPAVLGRAHRGRPTSAGDGGGGRAPDTRQGEERGGQGGEERRPSEGAEPVVVGQAVKSEVDVGRSSAEEGRKRRRSCDSSLGELQRIRDLSTGQTEKPCNDSPEHRNEPRGSTSLSRSGSRDLSLEGESVSGGADSESSGSSRDLALGLRRSSRDSDSTGAEDKSDKASFIGHQESRCPSKTTTADSVAELQGVSCQKSGTSTRSCDEASESPPTSLKPSCTRSRSCRITGPRTPSKSPAGCHCRSQLSESSSRTRSAASQPSQTSCDRRRRRSASDPGRGGRGPSPPAAETAARQLPASRDRLQGVLSVLTSQVEVIQAMVGHRGRAARRCRSLSRRISRNRVSVSPRDVVDKVEVVGAPVGKGRRAAKSDSGNMGRCLSEGTVGKCRLEPARGEDGDAGSEWTAGRGGAGCPVELRGDLSRAGGRRHDSTPPDCRPADRDGVRSGPGPVRRRHAAGVGPTPDRGNTLPTHPDTLTSGRRVSDDRAAARQGVPGDRRPAPPAGTGSSAAPPAGHQVPPLSLSEPASEQGDGPASSCSLVSPRTVSPTRKVEQWRARLAEVSPEPPPDSRPPVEEPAAPSRPGPELRRLAGAVRGLQRQMSGFCRLVEGLRSPHSSASPRSPAGSPCAPGSPRSSEASGRRRRYLRERRGLQLPLLPDKPAVPPPPPPGPGPEPPGRAAPGPGQRRWDIRRPQPPRRAASCERAVQTETELRTRQLDGAQTRAAVARSDGELRSSAGAARRFHESGASAQWDRANLLAREVNLRSRCILEGVIRSTAC